MRRRKKTLTAALLRAVLRYDPLTGEFTWLPRGKWLEQPRRAGWVEAEGYLRIQVFGRSYVAQRLAWLYMTGEWPDGLVDHRDRVLLNNKWENLRDASHSQNACNQKARRTNKLRLKGVKDRRAYVRSGKRFEAWITKNYKAHFLGSFHTPEEAHAAYKRAATELHGEFARAA